MDDIAAQVGVSRSTVSFVLGGRADSLKISQQTRDRVHEVARNLGYRPNRLVRAMVTGKSRMLGVIVPSEGDNVLRVLAGALSAANERNYLLKILQVSSTGGINAEIIERCAEWRLSGVIAIGLNEDALDALHAALTPLGIPLAMVDNAPEREWGVRVLSDNAQGVRLVLDHLIALGHRRIAFLGGRPGPITTLRRESFRAAMQDAGLTVPDRWLQESEWSEPTAVEKAALALLRDDKDRPTAILCGGDAVAMITLRVARAQGLRLPQDLSVTGFANFYLSQLVDPPLTTVDQPFRGMGSTAVEHLVAWVEEETSDPDARRPVHHLLPTKLLVRGSTAPVPTHPELPNAS